MASVLSQFKLRSANTEKEEVEAKKQLENKLQGVRGEHHMMGTWEEGCSASCTWHSCDHHAQYACYRQGEGV